MKKFFVSMLIAVSALCGFIGCQADNKPTAVYYTVTFDSQGGSVVSGQDVVSGEYAKRPSNPRRDGYIFSGWYVSALTEADSKWHFDTDRVTKDITLYAGWTADDEQEEITKMYISVNGNKLEVTLADNSSVDALVEILKQGDITYTADDYGGFEKVGSLGHTLPASNSQITTRPGDVILYSGNQIVLFYGSNSWSYTRLGRIEGYSADELKTLLGAGNGSVQVTISLA